MRFGTNNINYFKFFILLYFIFFVEKNGDSLSGINVGVRCEKRQGLGLKLLDLETL